MSGIIFKSMATNNYPTGWCCEGTKCKAPEQELRLTHKCKICIQIVHLACVHKTLLTDKAYCSNCYSSMEGTENVIEPSINEISVDSTNTDCVISTIIASESDEWFDINSKDYLITKD